MSFKYKKKLNKLILYMKNKLTNDKVMNFNKFVNEGNGYIKKRKRNVSCIKEPIR